MSVESIKIIAAIMGIIGSVILAYRVTGILSALSVVANCHDVNIQQLMPNETGDIHNFINSTKRLKKAQKTGLLITGFVFFILAFILQLIALMMASV